MTNPLPTLGKVARTGLLNLDARTGHEATAIDREAQLIHAHNLDTGEAYTEAYDKLVLSWGRCPFVCPAQRRMPFNVECSPS